MLLTCSQTLDLYSCYIVNHHHHHQLVIFSTFCTLINSICNAMWIMSHHDIRLKCNNCEIPTTTKESNYSTMHSVNPSTVYIFHLSILCVSVSFALYPNLFLVFNQNRCENLFCTDNLVEMLCVWREVFLNTFESLLCVPCDVCV